jgi:predicted pyridoxine 5'-phosphate oxidase superfamily flavin-nucleotide-binding protein
VPISSTELTPTVRAFLGAPHVATLATVTEAGGPAQAVIWYRLEPDDTILVNSRLPRRWPTSLLATRRASLAVLDERDGMRWVGLDCRVADVEENVARAREDIVELAHRYDDAGPDPLATFRSQARISFQLAIERIHDHLSED